MYDAILATACTAFGIGLWVGLAITARSAARRLAAAEALAAEWAADPDGLPRADVCARKLEAALR